MKRAAAQATDAADALLDWLSTQAPRAAQSDRPVVQADSGLPEEHGTEPISLSTALSDPLTSTDAVERTGPSRPQASGPSTAIMRLPHPDWLHHRLTISGPPEAVAAFKRAAAGAGVIPWHFDLDCMEEDFFHLLVSPVAAPGSVRQLPRQLSIAGARIFARQLREAVGHRHDVACRAVGHSRACPFDLHALVPVPAWVLALGPDEPQSLAWLWEHWGTTEALRRVTEESGDPAAGKVLRKAEPDSWQLSFWSSDWTPWRALHHLGLGWPVLRFACRPTYDAS
jgi:hypothetical protein